MIKGLIFDMDGVLLDTEPLHCEAWQLAFLQYGRSLSKEEYLTYCQAQGYKNAVKNIFPQATPEITETIAKIKTAHFNTLVAEKGVHLYEDAVMVLETLSACELPMAIASSSRAATKVLEQTAYATYFKSIVSGQDILHNKPASEIFELALSRLNLPKEAVYVIEDSMVGIIAARRAGFDTIAISRNGSLDSENPYDPLIAAEKLGLVLTPKERTDISLSKTILVKDLRQLLPNLIR